MVSAPVTPAQAQERALKLVRRNLGAWAVSPVEADCATLELPLHPPTERAVLKDQPHARKWVDSWRGVDGVTWEERRWASVGTQSLPVRLRITGAEPIARFAGRTPLSKWMAALELVALARDTFRLTDLSDAENALGGTLARKVPGLLKLERSDALRCIELAGWLSTHDVSGLLLRHVPLPGVDTKWLGRHQGMVRDLVAAATGRDGLGLAAAPERTRVRLLDPTTGPGLTALGLSDVEAPLRELAQLAVTPTVVLVVENRETFIALPPLPGVVAIEGLGYGAGERVSQLPWTRSARILYWGDLDSHGLAILDQFRSRFPDAESVLMDRETLAEFRELAVVEPAPTSATMFRLTGTETQALKLLRESGDLRLEQERIPWPWAKQRLETILADVMDLSGRPSGIEHDVH